MADTKTRGRSADRKRLNKSEPYEVAYAKSERASPARKNMLSGGGSGRSAGSRANGNGSGASGGASAKGSSAAKKAGASRKSASGAGARKSSGSASRKSSGSASGKSSGSGARKSSSAGTRKSSSARSQAKSPSAAKRAGAAPTRARKPSTRGTPKPPKEEKTTENTAPRTMREADAVDLLTDDHLEVSALFKRYEKLAKKEAPAAERRALAQTICEMLKAHTAIEEEIFYPAARRAGIDADMLDEAKIEHASAKDLIAQIEMGNPADDLYDAKVTVLGEYIQHHVVEEHTEMFPKCRRGTMDLVALRGELEARKMSILPGGGDGAMRSDGAAAGADGESPGLLAKLSDKLFSSEDGADKRGGAPAARR